jgi:hypothetical protein
MHRTACALLKASLSFNISATVDGRTVLLLIDMFKTFKVSDGDRIIASLDC